MSHNLATFHWKYHCRIQYEGSGKCQIRPAELFQFVNLDGLSFLTALVSFNRSDYFHHSNKDSDWLIVMSFMRV